jgi:2-C-methyl-D-erythritol 4-phosphate cytidylyltransferase
VKNDYVAAIIVAAGNGVRMGGGVSKVLLKLGAETILERSVNAFLGTSGIDELILVCRAEDQQAMERLPYVNPSNIPLSFIKGGRVRQESVYCGLQYLADRLKDHCASYVAVHDAARCFIRSETIAHALDAARSCQAVTVAVPLVDSLKRVAGNGKVEESVSREHIWCVQTPQVFRFDLLYEAHRRNLFTGQGPGATDDASLVEQLQPVYVSAGDRSNFKITTPEDYELARSFALVNSL